MKKFSRFFSTIALFVTVFAFSCIPTFAATTTIVAKDLSGSLSGWSAVLDDFFDLNYYVGSATNPSEFVSEGYGIYRYSGSFGLLFPESVRHKYLTGVVNVLFQYDPNNSMIGATSYESSSLVTEYSSGITDGSATVLQYGNNTSGLAYAHIVFNDYFAAENTFYFNIKASSVVKGSVSRTPAEYNSGGYASIRPRLVLTGADFAVDSALITVRDDSQTQIPNNYDDFQNDLSSFDSQMNAGSTQEGTLSDKALGDINSYEFKDLKDDSSILSSLTFYTSVINLAYASLDSTIQTLFVVSFGVLIVIFILRIRRDSS